MCYGGDSRPNGYSAAAGELMVWLQVVIVLGCSEFQKNGFEVTVN